MYVNQFELFSVITEWTLTRKKTGCPAVTLTTVVESTTISLDVVLCLEVKSSWPPFTQDGLKVEQWLGAKVKRAHKWKPYYLVPKYEGKGTVENEGVLAKGKHNLSEKLRPRKCKHIFCLYVKKQNIKTNENYANT